MAFQAVHETVLFWGKHAQTPKNDDSEVDNRLAKEHILLTLGRMYSQLRFFSFPLISSRKKTKSGYSFKMASSEVASFETNFFTEESKHKEGEAECLLAYNKSKLCGVTCFKSKKC